MKHKIILLILFAFMVLPSTSPVWAQLNLSAPAELEGVTVIERLEAQIPLDAEFLNEKGNPVRLKDLFNGEKPILLTLNYFSCPMLCTLQLNGMLDALKEIDWTPGKEFDIVTISFDPTETPILAKNKKQSYLNEYGRAGAAQGWHFLTGTKDNIQKVCDSVGFSFKWNDERKEYMHIAAIMVCTPQGVVSRYLYGVLFEPRTIRLSLVEAGEGKVGTTMDRIILFCFHYSASEGKYAIAATQIMKLGGLLTLLIVGGFLSRLWFRETGQTKLAIEGNPS